MMSGVQYSVFGHIAVSQRSSDQSCSIGADADVAVFALGWETRSTALENHVSLRARRVLLLSFAFEGPQAEAIALNKAKLIDFVTVAGAEIITLELGHSTDYQKNVNLIEAALKQLSNSFDSDEQELQRVFVECSSMPRIYIQWLVAYHFKLRSISYLEFGYAEGLYAKKTGNQGFATGVAKYVTVPLLHGSGGMGEEKFLVVGIGGDSDLFYGLIDEFSPERIALLVARDTRYPQIEKLLNQQVAKVTETYRLNDNEVTDIDAFGLDQHLKALEAYGLTTGSETSISVFVCGPKVQAIASAIYACVDSRVHIKARIPTHYPHRDVKPCGRYHIYRLIDLTSPSCSLPGTF